MRTSIMATSAFSGLNCLDVTTRACALALVGSSQRRSRLGIVSSSMNLV
jgi:hypothetical protein